MKYTIELECAPVLSRFSSTSKMREVAVFNNGDRKVIDWVHTLVKGQTLRDVMTLGAKK